MFIDTDDQRMLFEVALRNIPHLETAEYEKSFCLGLRTEDKELCGVVLFNSYIAIARHASISIYCRNPMWARPHIVRDILRFAFEDWALNKLYAETDFSRKKHISQVQKLGFVPEAVLEDHYGPARAAMILKMMKRDYMRLWSWAAAEKAAAAIT